MFNLQDRLLHKDPMRQQTDGLTHFPKQVLRSFSRLWRLVLGLTLQACLMLISQLKSNSTAPHANAVANPIVYQPSNADDLTKHPKYHSLL